MATTEKVKNNEPKPETKVQGFVPDSSFEDSVELPEIDGWFNPEICKGEWFKFRLLGSFKVTSINQRTRQDEVRTVFVCRVGSPVMAIDAKNKQVNIPLSTGQILGIGERAKLQALSDYKEGTILAMCARGQKQLSGGRKMWVFEIRPAKGSEKKTRDDIERELAKRPVKAALGANADIDDSAGEDDIPF